MGKGLNKDRIIARLMETKFADDDPRYFTRNVRWLETFSAEDLQAMLEAWENYIEN